MTEAKLENLRAEAEKALQASYARNWKRWKEAELQEQGALASLARTRALASECGERNVQDAIDIALGIHGVLDDEAVSRAARSDIRMARLAVLRETLNIASKTTVISSHLAAQRLSEIAGKAFPELNEAIVDCTTQTMLRLVRERDAEYADYLEAQQQIGTLLSQPARALQLASAGLPKQPRALAQGILTDIRGHAKSGAAINLRMSVMPMLRRQSRKDRYVPILIKLYEIVVRLKLAAGSELADDVLQAVASGKATSFLQQLERHGDRAKARIQTFARPARSDTDTWVRYLEQVEKATDRSVPALRLVALDSIESKLSPQPDVLLELGRELGALYAADPTLGSSITNILTECTLKYVSRVTRRVKPEAAP